MYLYGYDKAYFKKYLFEISDKIFGTGIGIGTTFFLKRLDSFYLARARKMMRKQ